MHFGKIFQFLFIGAIILSLFSCDKKTAESTYFISPAEGAKISFGESITLKTDAEPGDFDSIKYLVDAKFIASRKDTQGVKVPTEGMPFGGRLLTAIVYSGKDSSEVTTNIQLLPAKAPAKLSYTLVNTFPHDTTSYTQGLEFHDGVLYESDGLYGESSLRKVDFRTGKVLKKVDIPAQFFAEGITLVGDKILMLTWKEGVAFEFDRNTFQKVKDVSYTAAQEGWGLCSDGKRLFSTDGTNNIHILNKDTYQKEAIIEVYDNNGPVDQLNEMEFIDGKIYANIYQKNLIAIINPSSGGVEAYIDLTGILPEQDRVEGITDVLNGIAWDAKGKRLFVTGKKWNKLFEIKVNN